MQQTFSEHFSLLNEAVLKSVHASGEQEIIKNFTDIIFRILKADYGWAFLLNEGDNEKFRLIYKHTNVPFSFEPPFPRAAGITEAAFNGGVPIYESNYIKSRWLIKDLEPFIKGFVAIPICYKNYNYGTFNICYKDEHEFTEQEKTLCEFIGNSAAQMITIHRLVKSDQDARAESEKQKSRFQALIENSFDAISLINPQGKITYASASVAKFSGYMAEDLVGVNLADLIYPEDLPIINQSIREILSDAGNAKTVEFRYRHKAGNWRWLESTWLNMLDNPTIGNIVVNVRDITERKQAQAIITRQATHDSLTGLANRDQFRVRFNQALAQAERHGRQLAVMFLDMDRFKNVNDRLGHSEGDTLLKVVASRLTSCLRAEDVASRFGGDEFLILVNEIRSSKDAVAAAEKILKGVNLPVKIGAHTLHPSVSVGISIYPNDGLDLESLKKNADIALYRAKEQGRNRFSLYDHSLNGLYEAERFTLENDLRQALLQNQIEVFYQPIISLKKDRMAAVEALARWMHPERGLLLPSEFITLAEETGLIAELDKLVLRKACRQAKAWQDMRLKKFRMAVNLSAKQFSEPEFVSGIASILAETGLEGNMLELEITESLAMNNLELTSQNLTALKKLGVQITIDDFGTGYSSLNYLKRFPIHGLKIDKSFIRNCIVSPQDTSLVKAIVAMAQALNLKVTAEGVEEIQQLGFLSSLGCDNVQGFFVGKPMPAKDLPGWLKAKYPEKAPTPVLENNLIQIMEPI